MPFVPPTTASWLARWTWPPALPLGQDAGYPGPLAGVCVTADLRLGLNGARVLIDFTRPEGTLAHLKLCRELGVHAVIGTTGFSDAQKAEIAAELLKDHSPSSWLPI